MLNIAIVGLGRIGSQFLQELLPHAPKGVNVLCVSEQGETPGKILARRKAIRIMQVEEIVAMGESVDIIFDLTGQPEVRRYLRDALAETRNNHTVVAPETMAQLIWCLITDKLLPENHSHKGY